ncbi:MAG TPA: hypothetical protein VFX12_02150 [Vicinamibacterales bacterium]|nr:hypothetical protein [Vicinamibacterales bacterium]
MLLWAVTIVALGFAWAAWSYARRLSRKLEALNQSYWELRYDVTRLRSQVGRLAPGEVEAPAAPATPPSPTVAFVPLSSMRKNS